MTLLNTSLLPLFLLLLLVGCQDPTTDTAFSLVDTEDEISSVASNTDTDDTASDDEDIELTAFNLSEITASKETIKEMVLSWDSASTATGVKYSVCEKDISQINNCLELTSVTDELTANIAVDSLVESLSKDYFILASLETLTQISNEKPLTAETTTQMIGYFAASDAENQYGGGTLVSLSGDGNTLVVGGLYGRVYVFKKIEGKWEQEADLTGTKTEEYDSFGYAISLSEDGNTLAVSAPWTLKDDEQRLEGEVYLFNNGEDGWEQISRIKASNAGYQHLFGLSLSLSHDGKTLAVGAPNESSDSKGINSTQYYYTASDVLNGGIVAYGAVYVFRYEALNGWVQTDFIKASNTGKDDNFGSAVALSGDGSTLAVGASGEDNADAGIINGSYSDADSSTESGSGAVYIFKADIDNVWSQSAYIKASNPGYIDWFGSALAFNKSGDTLAVAAYGEDNAGTGIINGSYSDEDSSTAYYSGAVYLFENDINNGWSQSAYIKASNTGANDKFGRSLSFNHNGDILVVSAPYEDNSDTGISTSSIEVTGDTSTSSDSGAVYLFENDINNGWSQSAYIKASNTGAGDGFGVPVSLNGEGDTLAVGAYSESSIKQGVITDGSETIADNGEEATKVRAVYLY